MCAKKGTKNAIPFHWPEKKIWHALCGSGEQQSEESQVQHTSDCETTNWSRGSGKRVAPLVTKVERTSCTAATLHTRVTTSSSTPAQSLPVAGRGETTLRPRPQSTRAAVGCISLPRPKTIRNLAEREKNMRQRENIFLHDPEQQTPLFGPEQLRFQTAGTHARLFPAHARDSVPSGPHPSRVRDGPLPSLPRFATAA